MKPDSLIHHLQTYCLEKEMSRIMRNDACGLSMAAVSAIWVAGGLVDLMTDGTVEDLDKFCKLLRQMKTEETLYDRLSCISVGADFAYDKKGRMIEKKEVK